MYASSFALKIQTVCNRQVVNSVLVCVKKLLNQFRLATADGANVIDGILLIISTMASAASATSTSWVSAITVQIKCEVLIVLMLSIWKMSYWSGSGAGRHKPWMLEPGIINAMAEATGLLLNSPSASIFNCPHKFKWWW